MADAAYYRKYDEDRRVRLRALLGGVCVRCGTTDDLEFDHIDPATKSFAIGVSIHRRWSDLVAEVAKCQLLCGPCHRAKTAESGDDGAVPHGGGMSGKKNCPCELCKARMAEYMRSYMQSYRGTTGAPKTHCKNGHAFTPENMAPRAGGGRRCKVCNREEQARRRARG